MMKGSNSDNEEEYFKRSKEMVFKKITGDEEPSVDITVSHISLLGISSK
jgi:hypothetical protein